MTEIKVEQSKSLDSRMLYVTIATRMGISRILFGLQERYEKTKEAR